MSWNRESKLRLGVDSNCSFSLFGHRVMRLSGVRKRKGCQLWARAEYSFHVFGFWLTSMSWLVPSEDKAPELHFTHDIWVYRVTISYTFPEKQIYVLKQGWKKYLLSFYGCNSCFETFKIFSRYVTIPWLFKVQETVKKT